MIMTNFYDTLSYLNSKSPLSFTERCWRSPRRTQEARTIAREPFHSIADVRLWWRNATTRSAIHHRAVMSHAVYPVKWIQSTLGGDVTDERRGGTETQRYKMKQRERERERYAEWESRTGENTDCINGWRNREGEGYSRQSGENKETEGGEGWHNYYVTTHRETARYRSGQGR